MSCAECEQRQSKLTQWVLGHQLLLAGFVVVGALVLFLARIRDRATTT